MSTLTDRLAEGLPHRPGCSREYGHPCDCRSYRYEWAEELATEVAEWLVDPETLHAASVGGTFASAVAAALSAEAVKGAGQ